MHAEDTRLGGRYLLNERGGYDAPRRTIWQADDDQVQPATAPLWCFLSARSLAALVQCYRLARAA